MGKFIITMGVQNKHDQYLILNRTNGTNGGHFWQIMDKVHFTCWTGTKCCFHLQIIDYTFHLVIELHFIVRISWLHRWGVYLIDYRALHPFNFPQIPSKGWGTCIYNIMANIRTSGWGLFASLISICGYSNRPPLSCWLSWLMWAHIHWSYTSYLLLKIQSLLR